MSNSPEHLKLPSDSHSLADQSRRREAAPFGAEATTPRNSFMRLTKVETISVPRAVVNYQKEGVAVRYVVVVNSSFNFEKSFSEFRAFNNICKKTTDGGWVRPASLFYPSLLPPLPSTAPLLQSTNVSRRRIESRRAKLEKYLTQLVELSETMPHVLSLLTMWLQGEDNGDSNEDSSPPSSAGSVDSVPTSSGFSLQQNTDQETTDYKTQWLGGMRSESDPLLDLRLPSAAVLYGGPLGPVFEVTVQWGMDRDRVRERYFQLVAFHKWMKNWGDVVPGHVDVFNFLLHTARSHCGRRFPKPRIPVPTWHIGEHFVGSSDMRFTQLKPPRCACSPRWVCIVPGVVNEFHSVSGVLLSIEPPLHEG